MAETKRERRLRIVFMPEQRCACCKTVFLGYEDEDCPRCGFNSWWEWLVILKVR